MREGRRVNGRLITVLCAIGVTCVLGTQLAAVTVWTADAANAGPGIVILQLSDDADTDWAVNDLLGRLSAFITDDPFFPDRLTLIRTDDPSVATGLDVSTVIYVSHGGPLGIVTGQHLTSWKTMAAIVSRSSAVMHLFTACESRRLVSYGGEDSGKTVYTVPGIRPAEVTNVEIASTVMLALGLPSETVDEYRTAELTRARDLVQSGESVHLMDFEQVILDEIEYIDAHYSDTYTSEYMVLRSSTWVQLSGPTGFNALPLDLRDLIVDYYRAYFDIYGIPYLRTLLALSVNYTKNYYQEANWVSDGGPESLPPPGSENYSESYIMIAPPGHWEYGPLVFCGGTYSGVVVYSGDGSLYTQVWVNVTASGSVLDSVDSIALNQIGAGGVYVSNQKVDGTWSEPVVGRNPGRTGGLWTDPAARCDYEYDSSWPVVPGLTAASGSIGCTGDYLYVSSIPTGTGWHGPSFVQTLPSYFKLGDLGSFSANLSLFHGNEGKRATKTYVNLYDSNKKLVLSLRIEDTWYSTSGASDQRQTLSAYYYREDGTSKGLVTDVIYGNYSGVVQIRFDPLQGLFADVPGKSELWLYCYTQLNLNRLIKYVAVQSYRYGSSPEHDERVYDVRLSFAFSDYTVFHDACNDMYEFNKDLTFPYGAPSEGVLEVPSGQSYMKWTSIVTGTGWHGPQYVHVLDRPFRLYQLSDFSVVGQLVQSSSTMGNAYVGLFDENKQCVMVVNWGDAWSGSQKGWFNLAYYEGGASYSQGSGYIYTSFQKTAKIWWDPWQGGDGAIYSTIDGSGSGYPIAEVNNCSRVIKYVVTVGQRSNSYSLVDMRIHDINVVADLSRHDPTAPDPEEPVEYDGTRIGVAETNHEEADMDASDASQEVLIYWTGLWPLLHYEYHKQLIPSDVPSDHPAKAAAGRTLHVHVAKNLLSVTEYQDITISGDGSFGQTSDSVREEWLALLLAGYLIEIGFAGWALEAAIHVANPLAIALASIALSASVLLFYSLFLVFTVDMIDRGVWTCWDSAVKWWVLGLALFLAVFGVGLGMLFSLVGGATPSMKVETQAVTEGSKPLLSVVMKTKFAIWAILVLSALLIGTAVSLTVMSI